MDPLTHALAGATVAWAAGGRQLGRKSLLVGAVAGLLPDVDVLIRSEVDPLLAIEHHRGFTHSLLFIPLGAFIVALPFIARSARDRTRLYLVALLAYATHPLLDAATTYGTQLFWPFSRHRVGLDIISIIDPLFTLILLIALVAAFKTRRNAVLISLTIAILWLAAGAVQRERALDAQERLAASRNHTHDRGEVFPTVGNTVVWRSIYLTEGMLHIDRIRVPWFRDATYASTIAVPLAIAPRSVSGERSRDFRRFAWFSHGWVARDPSDSTVIGDARYSLRADTYAPVWGIRFPSGDERSTEWVNRTRDHNVKPRDVWQELTSRNLNFHPIP